MGRLLVGDAEKVGSFIDYLEQQPLEWQDEIDAMRRVVTFAVDADLIQSAQAPLTPPPPPAAAKALAEIEETEVTTTKAKPEIRIGDTFFMFDTNRRVYERDERGHATGGPTFRGHFYPVTITGETSRSWLTGGFGKKIPKADPFSVLYTEAMIDDAEWASVHRYRIERQVGSISDVDLLRRIAELIGYEGDR